MLHTMNLKAVHLISLFHPLNTSPYYEVNVYMNGQHRKHDPCHKEFRDTSVHEREDDATNYLETTMTKSLQNV